MLNTEGYCIYYLTEGKIMEKKRKEKGFTLVELIVVLAILAILASILVPALLGYVDRAREKKELLKAKSCMTLVQAALSEQYAITGDTLTPGGKAENVNATDKPWAMEILRQLDLKFNNAVNQDDDPYCIMFGVGSNYAASSTASKHDKYTVYFMFYMEKKDSIPLWYFNGSWRTSRPSSDEINEVNNTIKVGSKSGMRLQYYVISNKTGKFPAGNKDFMDWYNSLD